jgi:hypothetical protein
MYSKFVPLSNKHEFGVANKAPFLYNTNFQPFFSRGTFEILLSVWRNLDIQNRATQFKDSHGPQLRISGASGFRATQVEKYCITMRPLKNVNLLYAVYQYKSTNAKVVQKVMLELSNSFHEERQSKTQRTNSSKS